MGADRSIAVVGLGYIGLPTAVVLAAGGFDVVGVDLDTRKVDAVNRGELPFVEPDLAGALESAVSSGKLKATTQMPAADVYILAVPTPITNDNRPDLSYVLGAARSLAPHLRGGELVILESTSPPGATQLMADEILSGRPELSIDGADGKPVVHFAHCPERVLPGRIMIELVENDRIVGGLTPEATARASDIYRTFCRGEVLETDAVTAEMAKLTENAYRDVNIAFANELSLISDRLGIDVWRLIELANHHPRVNILQPGPGVGGHCIAVDPWFIVAAAQEESRLIHTARLVNDSKPDFVVNKAVEAAAELRHPTVAVLGLAFKANIDDLRESPSVEIVRSLAASMPRADILAVEPHVDVLPDSLAHRNVSLTDLDEALDRADIVMLLVDHDQFKAVDPARLEGKKLVDTKGLWV
jgi:UDP-N-acetyl-D-mannosaminuronic acid dehydrogenase